jgi:NAD-dependent deacetylase
MDTRSEETCIAINCAMEIIKNSENTTVLTGAGISTPSGIPDFRSSTDGLWSRYDPFEVASLTAFRHKPQNFFDWMRPLANKMYQAQPNAAHIGLARLERAGYISTIITQNIDMLHTKAGSVNVLEVHGSMNSMSCTQCFQQVDSNPFIESYLEHGQIPRCPQCEGILKPDIILMEEQLPARTWLKAVEASRSCDTMIVIGSSLEVVPVANLPMQAVDHGANLIIINKSHTYIDVRADIVFHEDLIDIVPTIVDRILTDN